MSDGFETLIYTDCRPGQGLQGSPGLQFQARSPDADPEAMKLVQSTLLYESPTSWMGQGRPVGSYPRSLAHVVDRYYATGAGVYLGREANGAREGNQLTHAVVTTDPDAYGAVRPAQLFGAPFWTTEPAPTTHCDPLGDDDWEPGPLDASRVQELVRTTPGGRDLLTALLSALQRLPEPNAPRVLFVCDDPLPVLGWITAGTLLLPQRQALGVSFKVFTTRPSYAVAQVLAVHPDWNRQHPTVANDQGYVVIDLTRNEWTPVAPTASASLWAGLFCTGDPYDVVDAVEVGVTLGLPDEQTVPVVAAAVLGRQPEPEHVLPLVRWLRDGPAEQLRSYGGGVADLLTRDVTGLPAAALGVLDEVALAGHRTDPGSPVWGADRVAAIRQALLAAELHVAVTGGASGSDRVPRLPEPLWTARHRREGQRRLAETLASAAPSGFEAALRVARRFELAAPIRDVPAAARAFVLDWADHPEHGYDPALWPDDGILADLCRDELRHRAAGSPQAAQTIADAWWPILEPRLQTVETDLDRAVLSAAVLHLPAPRRRELVHQFLRGALVDARSSAGLVGVLFARSPANPDEWELLLQEVPPRTPLPPDVFRSLRAALLDADLLPQRELKMCRQLRKRGLFVPDQPLAQLLDAVESLPDLTRELARATRRNRILSATLAVLPPNVVRTYADDLRTALLDNRRPDVVVDLLAELPGLVPAYLDQLCESTRRPGQVWHAVTAFLIGTDARTLPKLGRAKRSELGRAGQRWLARANERQVAAATELVRDLERRELTARWEEHVTTAKERGWLGRLWHRSR